MIEFLHYNYKKLKAGIARMNEGDKKEDFNIQHYIPGEYSDLARSIFLQRVIEKMRTSEDNTLEFQIEEWFKQAQGYKSSTSIARDLNTSLLKFLGNMKYDDTAAKALAKEKEKHLQSELSNWIECKEFMLEYKRFLQKNGDNLIAGMIEHVDAVEGVQDDLEVEIPRFFVEEDKILEEFNKKYSSNSNDIEDDIIKSNRLDQQLP